MAPRTECRCVQRFQVIRRDAGDVLGCRFDDGRYVVQDPVQGDVAGRDWEALVHILYGRRAAVVWENDAPPPAVAP